MQKKCFPKQLRNWHLSKKQVYPSNVLTLAWWYPKWTMIFLLGQRPHCPKHQGWCWMFPHSLSLQSPRWGSLWSSTWKHLWVLRTSPLVGWFLALGSLGHYLSKWARATGRQTPPHSKWRARLAWAGISGVWTSCTWLHLFSHFFLWSGAGIPDWNCHQLQPWGRSGWTWAMSPMSTNSCTLFC